MSDLHKLRSDIDAIDKQIVDLVIKRMEVVSQIAVYKKERELPIVDANREQLLLDKISQLSKGEYENYIRDIYEKLMRVSCKYQEDFLKG